MDGAEGVGGTLFLSLFPNFFNFATKDLLRYVFLGLFTGSGSEGSFKFDTEYPPSVPTILPFLFHWPFIPGIFESTL